jgi:DeoR family transcriptional regulator, aga operon transcriptional repressor
MSTNTGESLPAELRQARIRALLATQEFVRVSELAGRFATSEVTIRTDLMSLEAAGHLRRVHGGAVPRIVHRQEQPFDITREAIVERHAGIGRAAAALVEPGDALILDVGTTTTAVARAIVERADLDQLVIFTNGLNIALELERAHPRVTVVVTGGTLRPMQHSLVNPMGEDLLRTIKANVAFIGCNGVDVASGVTNVNLPEAEIKRRMLEAVRKRVVVADHSKHGHVELARICAIEDVDVLVTDAEAEAEFVSAVRARGPSVVVAE